MRKAKIQERVNSDIVERESIIGNFGRGKNLIVIWMKISEFIFLYIVCEATGQNYFL
jgi:hypothetical protein